jgi:two-component system probable response regulator PhcQ
MTSMQNPTDYKRFAVLYVDDEEMALKYFEKSFGGEFRIITAVNADDGMEAVRKSENEIGVVLTDQRMPGQKGVQLLEQIRLHQPQIVRMLITAYADFGVTVDAVNIGNVFRYVSKPIQVEDMRNTLRRAIEFYSMQRERDDLMREKLSVLQQVVVIDRVISLGVLAAGLGSRLRNPMQAVQSFLGLMRRTLPSDPSSTSRLHDPDVWKELHSHVLKQASVLSDMLGFEPTSTPLLNEQRTDLSAVIQAAVASRATELWGKSISAQIQAPIGLPALTVDLEKLQKIVHLLIDGELALLPRGGTFTIATDTITGAGNETLLTLTITDHGPGLPWRELRSVIDPAVPQTPDSQAVGLRLMVVFLLVHDIGGSIDITDIPDGGTSFHIVLPLQSQTSASLESSSRDFIARILSNDVLWERLLPSQ